ncbi:DUF1254 domain-containing protein [Rhizobium sp. G187]|uniref:DUF1254 domain-containing protein n=1 Tax=unclassified Rhizobium TaxID=2613769 RepID=UPI0006B94C8F|nr:hypothetical protein [Rhizobium sp. AAP43]KPF42268.1 hypothetical protein IP76_17825 [Rhizobium sp. AAP43]
MSKLVYALLTGIIGAVLLHIIIILGVPLFTGRDAYTRVTAEGQPFVFHPLSATEDAVGLSSRNPYLRLAVCHFDIGTQPLSLTAAGGVEFWSMAIYDRDANEVFSMNDRTSVAGDLDVLLATPVQVAQLRKTPIAALAQTILVEHRGTTGYVVLRAMVPQPSLEAEATAFLADAECLPFTGR